MHKVVAKPAAPRNELVPGCVVAFFASICSSRLFSFFRPAVLTLYVLVCAALASVRLQPDCACRMRSAVLLKRAKPKIVKTELNCLFHRLFTAPLGRLYFAQSHMPLQRRGETTEFAGRAIVSAFSCILRLVLIVALYHRSGRQSNDCLFAGNDIRTFRLDCA